MLDSLPPEPSSAAPETEKIVGIAHDAAIKNKTALVAFLRELHL